MWQHGLLFFKLLSILEENNQYNFQWSNFKDLCLNSLCESCLHEIICWKMKSLFLKCRPRTKGQTRKIFFFHFLKLSNRYAVTFLWYFIFKKKLDVLHLATCIFLIFLQWTRIGYRNRSWHLTPFPSSILDETRFKPTTFWSWFKFANH